MPPTMLIFDIETRHDTDLMQAFGYQGKPEVFAPLIYHLPCAVAIGQVTSEGVLTQVESLTDVYVDDDPAELTSEFWDRATHAPVLISFNGRGFDIPVLELCALRFGAVCAKHWQDDQKSTRYRYSKSHIDLLDILSNGRPEKGFKLGNFTRLLGYTGKDDMDGSKVQGMYEAGQLTEIQAYNRLDVIRTYALWLQWSNIAGRLLPEQYRAALISSKPFLDQIR
jgi:predicted PolB exonuclease-like 3'-5' exonuclease